MTARDVNDLQCRRDARFHQLDVDHVRCAGLHDPSGVGRGGNTFIRSDEPAGLGGERAHAVEIVLGEPLLQQCRRDVVVLQRSHQFARFLPREPCVRVEDQWQLRPLSQAHAALAYEAILIYPTALIPQSREPYPTESYTWQNHIQRLKTVEQEQQTYKSFSYIVLNKAATKCLGMVRIMPLRPFLYYNNAPTHLIIRAGNNAAMISYWLAPCPAESSFACEFIQALQRWFNRNWEFDDYFFRINPSDSHCLATLADTGLNAQFSLKVPPDNYVFYSN